MYFTVNFLQIYNYYYGLSSLFLCISLLISDLIKYYFGIWVCVLCKKKSTTGEINEQYIIYNVKDGAALFQIICARASLIIIVLTVFARLAKF